MKKLLVVMWAIPLLLAGCAKPQNTTPTLSDRSVKWSSLSSTEQHAIMDVSKHYGDAHPEVLKIFETETDPDQKLMYLVHLKGHFKKGKVQSNDLSFSILGDGTKAWAISNKSGSLQDAQILLH